MNHVVCVGLATRDTLLAVARHPAADELVFASDVANGARGCTAYTRAGEVIDAVATPLADPVSTLGAGDVFHGALLRRSSRSSRSARRSRSRTEPPPSPAARSTGARASQLSTRSLETLSPRSLRTSAFSRTLAE